MSESNDKKAKSAPQLAIDFAPSEDAASVAAAAKTKAKAQKKLAAASANGSAETATAATGHADDDDLKDAVGLLKGMGATAWRYAVKHPGTAKGALAGFILAVLILTVGLWDTIIIAVFVLVGALIGQMRDGDNGIVNFFGRLFGGGR